MKKRKKGKKEKKEETKKKEKKRKKEKKKNRKKERKMRTPYAPAYEAYTHFGASAEDASAEDANAEEEATAAITTRKKVIRNALLSPVPSASSEVPYRGPSELTFESDGKTHTLQLTYIARGDVQHSVRRRGHDGPARSARVVSA